MKKLRRKLAVMMSALNKGDNILTFTAEEVNAVVQFAVRTGTPSSVNLETSVNGGLSWQPYTVGDVITLPNIGDSVKFRGVNSVIQSIYGNDLYNFVTGKVAASGDVTSLLNGVGGDVTLSAYAFCRLFSNSNITKAPNLPSTAAKSYCYFNMFRECPNLVTGPHIALLNSSSQMMRYCFYNSPLVDYVRFDSVDISASLCIDNWLYGVAATGTLVCDSSLVLPSGVSGLPAGWTRVNLDGTPYVAPNS